MYHRATAAAKCWQHSQDEAPLGWGSQLHKSLQCGITHFYWSAWAWDFLRGTGSRHRSEWPPFRDTVYGTFYGFPDVLKQLDPLPTGQVNQVRAPSVVVVCSGLCYLWSKSRLSIIISCLDPQKIKQLHLTTIDNHVYVQIIIDSEISLSESAGIYFRCTIDW